MASLKNHKKRSILFEMDDIVLKAPNKEQEKILKDKIAECSTINEDKASIEASMEIIRYILKELTNIDNKEIDSLTDEELDVALDGDEVLLALCREIEKLVTDIGRKLMLEIERALELMNDLALVQNGKAKIEDLTKKYNKLLEQESKKK